MRKILLEQHQSPGDIVVMTGAVRDLKLAHPDYLIMPDTTCLDVWLDNPHISWFNRADDDIERYMVGYPDIHNSNTSGRHFSQAFHLELEQLLGVRIPQTTIYPDLHVKGQRPSLLEELTGHTGPYWILNAGYKEDFPLKDWGTRRYQRLVEILRGVVQFVQVGEFSPGHYHPDIDGVINIVGKTSMRDFIILCSQAAGSVGPVSMHSHVMAAFRKPCVVIGGGREPYRWEAYPNQRYLHVNGCLPCCNGAGCWRKWSSESQAPEHDRDSDGLWRSKICETLDNGEPRCMTMIEPGDVAREIMRYYQGGVLP